MSKREDYESRTEKLLQPILDVNHFELWDVEYVKEGGNWYLRAYIDKEGGITVDDCEIVSRALSDKLDEQDFVEDAYILEISSPGLGRQLKKDRDLARSIGEEVEIHTYKPIDKEKTFFGFLTSFDEKEIVIEYAEDEYMTFDRKNIAIIRLAFDF